MPNKSDAYVLNNEPRNLVFLKNHCVLKTLRFIK